MGFRVLDDLSFSAIGQFGSPGRGTPVDESCNTLRPEKYGILITITITVQNCTETPKNRPSEQPLQHFHLLQNNVGIKKRTSGTVTLFLADKHGV